MDSGRIAGLIAGFQSEALLNLADSVIAEACEEPAWLEDLGTTRDKTKESWRQDNNHYCNIKNRFHITALANPH